MPYDQHDVCLGEIEIIEMVEFSFLKSFFYLVFAVSTAHISTSTTTTSIN